MEVLGARVEGAQPGAGVSWEEGGEREAVVAPRPPHARRVLQHVESLAVVARHFLQRGAGTVTSPEKK